MFPALKKIKNLGLAAAPCGKALPCRSKMPIEFMGG
jgi:hypothetical protein